MGDVAMTVPVLRALIKQHPNIKVTVLTRKFFEPFFRDLHQVKIYEADVKGKHKGLLGLFRLSKELRSLDIDAVADLHNVLRSKILKVFFSGVKTIQIDKGRAEKKALVSGKNFKQLKTTHQRYADVFRALGFQIDISQPTFPEKSELSATLKKSFSKPNLPLIGVAPFAAHKGKMYPLDQMEQLLAKLSSQYNLALFGGGKEEITVLNTFEKKYNNVYVAAGKLSLNDELDLISNLDVMLSMDSGNAHIAAMLGVKVLTIWGVTHPYAGFAPFNQPADFCLLADRDQYPLIPTSIYGNTYPKDYEDCAGSISVETIAKKVREIIANPL